MARITTNATALASAVRAWLRNREGTQDEADEADIAFEAALLAYGVIGPDEVVSTMDDRDLDDAASIAAGNHQVVTIEMSTGEGFHLTDEGVIFEG